MVGGEDEHGVAAGKVATSRPTRSGGLADKLWDCFPWDFAASETANESSNAESCVLMIGAVATRASR